LFALFQGTFHFGEVSTDAAVIRGSALCVLTGHSVLGSWRGLTSTTG